MTPIVVPLSSYRVTKNAEAGLRRQMSPARRTTAATMRPTARTFARGSPTSPTAHLTFPYLSLQKKKPRRHHISGAPVGLPGFEPGMTGPESVVLPLHHSPNGSRGRPSRSASAKIHTFQLSQAVSPIFSSMMLSEASEHGFSSYVNRHAKSGKSACQVR